jgi:hypothetical protein
MSKENIDIHGKATIRALSRELHTNMSTLEQPEAAILMLPLDALAEEALAEFKAGWCREIRYTS